MPRRKPPTRSTPKMRMRAVALFLLQAGFRPDETLRQERTDLAAAAAFAPIRDGVASPTEPCTRRGGTPGIGFARSSALIAKDLPCLIRFLCLVMLGGRPRNGDMGRAIL